MLIILKMKMSAFGKTVKCREAGIQTRRKYLQKTHLIKIIYRPIVQQIEFLHASQSGSVPKIPYGWFPESQQE